MPGTFNVTIEEVVAQLPSDARDICADTVPLSTGDVARIIEDADAETCGIFGMVGADASQATDQVALAQGRAMIKAYAVAECLKIMGYAGAIYAAHRQKYEDLRDQYRDRPQLLASTTPQFDSNIDPNGEREQRRDQGRTFRTGYVW